MHGCFWLAKDTAADGTVNKNTHKLSLASVTPPSGPMCEAV